MRIWAIDVYKRQEQYEDREMQALKAMLFGAKLPPQEEEPPQPVKPAEPEKSTPAVPVDVYKRQEPGVGSGRDRGKLVPKSGMEDGEKSCVRCV